MDGLRSAWATLFPGLPQIETREQAEIAMHHARTGSASIPLKPRAFSHRWLCERGLPSALPDEMKPSAERLFPVIAEGVLISVNFRSPDMKRAESEVRGAMELAVLDAEADGRLSDPEFVRSRIGEAKSQAIRLLFGEV